MLHAQLHLLLKRETGATAVEYGLMVALIAGILLAGIISLGTSLSALFTSLTTAF